MEANKIEIPRSELRRLVDEGYTDKEISQKLFISETTVKRRRWENNILRPRYQSDFDPVLCKRMMEIGLSNDTIAHIFGITRKALNNHKYRSGLTRRYNRRKQG